MDYNLAKDEYIIFTDVGVIFDGKFKCNSTEAILTNKNIVCEYGTFKKKQQVFPLNTIKERRGKLQMQIVTGESDRPCLTIYFEKGSEDLYFAKFFLPMKARARMQEWMNAIEKSLSEPAYSPVPAQEVRPVASQVVTRPTAAQVVTRPADSQVVTRPAAQTAARPSGSFCPSCGASITPGAAFCSSCGVKIGEKPFSAEEQGRLLKCLEELLDAGVITSDLYVEKQRYIQNRGR